MQPNLHFYSVSFAPDIAGDKKLKPQQSYHRSVSIEQKVSEYTFRVEGFYNNFWDVIAWDRYTDSDGKEHLFANKGKLKTKGVEVMAKISDEHEEGLFGWISYTTIRRFIFRISMTRLTRTGINGCTRITR
jgi:outer membrane receptor for ferrienterochelin and colicin